MNNVSVQFINSGGCCSCYLRDRETQAMRASYTYLLLKGQLQLGINVPISNAVAQGTILCAGDGWIPSFISALNNRILSCGQLYFPYTEGIFPHNTE